MLRFANGACTGGLPSETAASAWRIADGWTEDQFTAYCILDGLSPDTSRKLANGATNAPSTSLAIVARALRQESVARIMDLFKNGQ